MRRGAVGECVLLPPSILSPCAKGMGYSCPHCGSLTLHPAAPHSPALDLPSHPHLPFPSSSDLSGELLVNMRYTPMSLAGPDLLWSRGPGWRGDHELWHHWGVKGKVKILSSTPSLLCPHPLCLAPLRRELEGPLASGAGWSRSS